MCIYLLSSADLKLHIGGNLEFKDFPKLRLLRNFNIFFGTIFLWDPGKISLFEFIPPYSTVYYQANVPGLVVKVCGLVNPCTT